MTENPKAYVCIMAGGSGERFWPLSRQVTPKHLLKLFSNRTLVEETVRRLEGVVPLGNIFVLTNEAQLAGTKTALAFLPPEQIIAEPAKRDTAPAAALATGLVRARDPEGVLALLPADALIKDSATFARQLSGALTRASRGGALLTFAIKPTYPATGFGYLAMAETLSDGFRRVACFVEKPDLATAKKYVAGGNHAWNAGMFMWRVPSFVAEAEKQAPVLAEFVKNFPSGDPTSYLAQHFSSLPKISVDYAIMEKATAVETQLAEFDWDDVGSWTALPSHLPSDESRNTTRGPVVVHNASNNIAISGGRVIALCGVKDLVVVETPDAVLVCHRDAVQNIKQLIPQLPPTVL
jgi:mannose-1-phosphate guanylyltransferase